MSETIRCEKLGVKFGATVALDGLTTALDGRRIVGLLGRNGCGKTTLLHTLLGLVRPTGGAVEVFGKRPAKLGQEDMARIGFVSQEGGYLETMTVQTHLNYIAAFYENWDKGREKALLEAFEIDPDARVGKLSGGNKQKLGILLAVCHRPELLLLDEPASALDPVVRREMFRLLFEMVEEDGATVVVSSHILMDVEKVIDHVWFLREGALVADEGLDELYERYAEWEVSASGDGAALPREFEDMFVLEQSGDGAARRLVVKAKEEERRFFEGKYGVDVVARPLGLERLFPLLAKG